MEFISTIITDKSFNYKEYDCCVSFNNGYQGSIHISVHKKADGYGNRNNDRWFEALWNCHTIVYMCNTNESNGNIKPWMLNMLSDRARMKGKKLNFWNNGTTYAREDYSPTVYWGKQLNLPSCVTHNN